MMKQDQTKSALNGILRRTEFEWIYGDSHYNVPLTKDQFLQLKRCLNQVDSSNKNQ